MAEEELPIDRLTDEIRQSHEYAERRAPAFARFEGRVVKFLLKHFNLPDGPDLVRLHEERTGLPRLTFADFFARYPTFPVWLVPRPVAFWFNVSFADLVWPKKRERLALFRAFRRLAELIPQDQLAANGSYGVVVEWLNSKAPGAFWVVHNDATADVASLAFTDDPGHNNVRETLGLQPFARFLANLRWTP